jgi:hypothetical protein
MLGYMPAPDETHYGDEPAKTVKSNGAVVDNTNGEYDSQDAKDAWEQVNNATVRFRDRLDSDN